MTIANVVSYSGGKDSTALLIHAVETDAAGLRVLFCDTGHEHDLTIEYVARVSAWLRERAGVEIETLRADFAPEFPARRRYILEQWPRKGVPVEVCERAAAALEPTGVPFLDLCLLKGLFPSTKRAFCTQRLKQEPLDAALTALAAAHQAVISWQGVRADSSARRAHLAEREVVFGSWEPSPQGLLTWRPILRWTVEDVFAAHRRAGIEPNPLYSQGFSRVGCFPCIHERKDGLRAIAQRYPEAFAKLSAWEEAVREVSKEGDATFFHSTTIPGEGRARATAEAVRQWSLTGRGGRQMDLTRLIDAPACSSVYGLCE
jgi:3'-phosphoadenosine 5'-phosphosulfate sulfotransferase (PAPS reductase)/FAD synthetase